MVSYLVIFLFLSCSVSVRFREDSGVVNEAAIVDETVDFLSPVFIVSGISADFKL